MLKEYDGAIKTLKKLIAIRPGIPEYLVTAGMIYFLVNDTVHSKEYFNDAILNFDKILDTMKTENKSFDYALMGKALSLVFIGSQQLGNDIFKKLYDKATDTISKEMYADYMNKSGKDIVNSIFDRSQDSTSVTTISIEPLELDTVKFCTVTDTSNYKFTTSFYLIKAADSKAQGFNLRNTDEYYYIAKNISLSLKYVGSVFKVFDKYHNIFSLNFNFSKTGTKELSDFTLKCRQQKIGLLINNKLVIGAFNFGQIENGKMELSGKFTEDDIDNLQLLITLMIKNLKTQQ